MAERSIKVRLRAEVTDFQREIGKATSSLDALVKKAGDQSGGASTFMGKLAQSAKHQSQEWETAGGAIAAAA